MEQYVWGIGGFVIGVGWLVMVAALDGSVRSNRATESVASDHSSLFNLSALLRVLYTRDGRAGLSHRGEILRRVMAVWLPIGLLWATAPAWLFFLAGPCGWRER